MDKVLHFGQQHNLAIFSKQLPDVELFFGQIFPSVNLHAGINNIYDQKNGTLFGVESLEAHFLQAFR